MKDAWEGLERSCLILGGLPSQYKPTILAWENGGTEITVDYVKNMILQDVLLNDDSENSETTLKCVKKIKDKKNDRKKKIQCYNCKGNHYRNKCPELMNVNTNDSGKVLFSAFLVDNKPDDWFFDSGATAHMTFNHGIVENFVASVEGNRVTAADGRAMKITGEGDVHENAELLGQQFYAFRLILAGYRNL
ncbi:uncharacterized protein LOC116347415 [Contarinia nasturtii]|uniref:uncharacterized protein LOC116347415 n=1 Tax=Contarinia nasturtii TaxID=265458 RepID=UPI0012D3A08C|nr:uncharacterized protein LOC116347415 [Contarinia nasturtii]